MKDNIIFALFLAASLALIVGLLVSDMKDELWQNEVIEHNAAEWRIDAKTGDKEFVWLTCEEK